MPKPKKSADIFGAGGQAEQEVDVLDLAGVKDTFEVVPPAKYPAEVLSAIRKKGPKAPFIAWRFRILSGKYKGQLLFTNTSLAQAALFSLKGLLKALGENVEVKKYKLSLTSMFGKKLMVSTTIGSYQNQPKTEVNGFEAYDAKAASEF